MSLEAMARWIQELFKVMDVFRSMFMAMSAMFTKLASEDMEEKACRAHIRA